jgi:hypothetical protein
MKKLENPKGAFLLIESREDKIEAFTYAMKKQMELDGIEVTPELEIKIRALIEEKQINIEAETKAKGIPEVFTKMLEFKNKKDISRFLESQTLTMSEISLLISNHEQAGLTHKRFHKEFMPEHLEVDGEEIKKLAEQSKKGTKLRKRLIQRFKQRKVINAHLFEKEDFWYCIFFDYNDMTDTHNPSHWVEGNHVHFISHHWGLSLDDVWSSFNNKKISLPKLHIRYTEEK